MTHVTVAQTKKSGTHPALKNSFVTEQYTGIFYMQLTLFYLWFYKVQFCNFRRLITWRSQLGPPIQVLYRVTLFIKKYINDYRDERWDLDPCQTLIPIRIQAKL